MGIDDWEGLWEVNGEVCVVAERMEVEGRDLEGL